jgi:hypothetical protein
MCVCVCVSVYRCITQAMYEKTRRVVFSTFLRILDNNNADDIDVNQKTRVIK